MIEHELETIIKAAEGLSPFLKKNIMNECRTLAIKYNSLVARNESILKEKYKIDGVFSDSIEKIINITKLHGYDSMNIDEIKDCFIAWMVKNAGRQYRNDHITRDLLSKLSTEYYMFVLDNDREPSDYTEFKKFIELNKTL